MTATMKKTVSALLIVASILITHIVKGSSSVFVQSNHHPTAPAIQQRQRRQQGQDVVTIAGVFDTNNDWAMFLFNVTFAWLNSDEGRQSIASNNQIPYPTFQWDIEDASCDPTTAARAYWNVRSRHTSRDVNVNGDGGGGASSTSLHGIVGARCSGASISIARIAGLEKLPQVSFASSSATLSDKEEYPYFSRVVSPDNANGQVGALVSFLRSMCWNSISIMQSDTDYSKDFANEFKRLWLDEYTVNQHCKSDTDNGGQVQSRGQVIYDSTILQNQDNTVDIESARQVLRDFQDNGFNSRVILLLAHDDDAYPILKTAAENNFQPDTIWVGPDSWIGRQPVKTSFGTQNNGLEDWIPNIPGYLGVTPFRNRNDEIYQNFLSFIRSEQVAQGRSKIWDEFPDYTAEYLIDATISLARALASVPPQQRLDGELVTNTLRLLSFDGVSGNVRFTSEGDRFDPQFSILNAQRTDNDGLVWGEVDDTKTDVGTTSPNISAICFPSTEMAVEDRCNLEKAPADQYPKPSVSESVKKWVPAVLVVISLLLIVLTYRYIRTKRKKQNLQNSISDMEKKMKEMKNIDDQLFNLDLQVADAKEKQDALIRKRAQLQEWPSTWSDSEEILVEVSATDDQYWDVQSRLAETMDDAYISRLWRVQNRPLWTYYSFHSDRLAM